MELPVVSVVIPTFNSADILPEVLDSVLVQTYPRVEILLVDDGSTDGTASVAADYGNRIRYFHQENWGGPSSPRNVGIQNALGEFVSFFDSDDLMKPGKLARAMEVFHKNPAIDFTFSNFQGVDEKYQLYRDDYLLDYREFRRDLEWEKGNGFGVMPGRKLYSQLLEANFIGTSSVVVRKSVFETVGLFDETMPNAEDVDLWRRIAYAGFRFAFIDEVLHSYRKSPEGISSRGVRLYPAILKGLTKQLKLDLDSRERSVLTKRINSFELGYAAALRRVGEFSRSLKIYRKVIKRAPGWSGIKGLLRLVFSSVLERKKTLPR